MTEEGRNRLENMLKGSNAVGTDNLLQLLKNYARTGGSSRIQTKQTITIGVVGFPNVGKSSLINSLKRSKAAKVGNTPGVTRSMQEIQIDNDLILLDCPGVVLVNKEQSDSLVLRSAIKIEDIVDPFQPVEALLKRIQVEELQKVYGLDPKAYEQELENFLGAIARKRGLFQGGGIPNMDQAARMVLRDYI